MKTIKLLAVAGLVLGLTACPYRQKSVRLVFVPTPPLAASSSAQSGVLVIQEPVPMEPAVTVGTQPSPPPQSVLVPPPLPGPPTVSKPVPEPAPAIVTPPGTGSPQLEPARSVQQQNAMEQRVSSLQRDVRRRIDELSRLNLSGASRKTLEDARMFVTQSQDAMKTGDLLQSYKLAQKADLLVGAVEKQR